MKDKLYLLQHNKMCECCRHMERFHCQSNHKDQLFMSRERFEDTNVRLSKEYSCIPSLFAFLMLHHVDTTDDVRHHFFTRPPYDARHHIFDIHVKISCVVDRMTHDIIYDNFVSNQYMDRESRSLATFACISSHS